MRQILGGPDWINTDRFDIEARAGHPSSVDDLHSMFQNLLADRFNLKFHKEVKEGPVYALSVDKSGLKMKADGTGQALGIPIVPAADGGFTGTRVPMQYLTWWLSQASTQNDGRPVVDETGLDQSYDFMLSFAPQLPPDVSRDSLPPADAEPAVDLRCPEAAARSGNSRPKRTSRVLRHRQCGQALGELAVRACYRSAYRGDGELGFFIRSGPVQVGSGLWVMEIIVKEFGVWRTLAKRGGRSRRVGFELFVSMNSVRSIST